MKIYHITHPNGQIETGKYTLIQCSSHDTSLHTYFLRIMGLLLVYLGDTPTQQEITETVDKLVDLFRPLTKPPKKSIQGLWAELYLIARLKKPAILVQAWHKNPKDYFDFYQDNQRIEVKSSASQKRVHHFSLEQLNPPEGIKVIVASLFVEHSQSGQSLANLIERINSRLSDKPDLILHLEKIISLTLGNDWRSASEEYFDVKLAEQSLAFFDVSNIPSVNPNLPIGVTNVKFQSDLTGVPTIDRSQYQTKGQLFEVVK